MPIDGQILRLELFGKLLACATVEKIFDPEKLLMIAGPCSLENERVTFSAAECLGALGDNFPRLNVIFKGSFDKANRTSIRSERGVGIVEGMRLLKEVKSRFGLRVTTDIHLPEQAAAVAEVCDVLQIPAFLCRQTDLVVAAAGTGKPISIKKGQFLSPYDMKHVVAKLEESGASEIFQIERGTSFGYNNLVVDMRSFAVMKLNGHPAIFDATHSVQLPGTCATGTGGDRTFIPILSKAAIASGADGIFFEIHPDPATATCDRANQIALEDFPRIVEDCLAIWETMRKLRNPRRRYFRKIG
ncbi:MAG: 3-deoxy-8-phosphooctulonate synthase [Puniceicoccales bacterium]|jgi:2-dehydro-3-deoxyphosphooctonate aldolase (KDO 8-P synthase)|nr:3-deoxy-8-phosphooctulonate synthase [Puniceicoccales bacterium]